MSVDKKTNFITASSIRTRSDANANGKQRQGCVVSRLPEIIDE